MSATSDIRRRTVLNWLRRLFRVNETFSPFAISTANAFDLSDGRRRFVVAVVGESNHQGAIRRISAGRRERDEAVEFIAFILPEPTNAYDPNAVAVFSDRGRKLSYLSREDA